MYAIIAFNKASDVDSLVSDILIYVVLPDMYNIWIVYVWGTT